MRSLLAQQVARAHLLARGILLQGEPTEADLHLLRSDPDALAARLRFLDQALTATDPATRLAMLDLL